MLNGVWIGGAPLNSGAPFRIIAFASDVSATAAATAADGIAIRGYASAVSAVASGDVTTTRERTFGAAVNARATQQATPGFLFSFSSEVAAFASSLLGASLTVEFASAVNATASGELLPFDALFDTSVSATAVADAVDMLRIRQFGASVSVSASAVMEDTVILYRGFGADVMATATQQSDPDVNRSGVRWAEFSCETSATASSEAEEVFYSIMASSVSARAVASPVAAPTVNRFREMIAGVHLAQANSDLATLMAIANFSASASCGVSSVAQLGKFQNFASAASASASAGTSTPRLNAIPATMRATASATASASMPAVPLFKGLSGVAFPRATAEFDGIRLAHKFGSEVRATAHADVELDYFTIYQFSADVTVTATAVGALERLAVLSADGFATASAVAELRTNVYDDEPEYRTDFVSAEDFTDLVDPEDFTLYVRDDDSTMKTFTKQPGDKLAYDVDFTDWFADLEGDDIESASAAITSADSGETTDLTIEQPLKIGDPCYRIKIWVDDGIDGATYKITATINTEGGRVKERDFQVRIKES